MKYATMAAACLLLSNAAFAVANHVNLSQLPLNKLKATNVEVTDPNESTPVKAVKATYKAYNGTEVLDLAFGGHNKWAETKTLIFKCTDGYMPTMETKEFLNGGFHFAFSREGSPDFSIVNNAKDNKKASLAPFYLIWDNKAMQIRGRTYYWPYQIVSVGTK